MKKNFRPVLYFAGGFLFLADRVVKYFAGRYPDSSALWRDTLGWHPTLNSAGVFSYPVNNFWLAIISLPILAAIFFFWLRVCRHRPRLSPPLLFIILGAISNLYDRLAYGGVRDYLFIFWGAINIGDLLIIGGALGAWLILKNKEGYVSQT